ncbi:3'-5' exonuclease [Azotobacter vinelandii]|uniref:3'-5' exonuclease n=1 Tax=Azotobacter vinelandii TaxID=354 RepID=UPI002666E3B3|nr:3'-5' exonuclease [Azotobacter vinelandii]WKN20931.1 ATP-binding domain-containing protein [Azotobacter vinelandii]
MAELIPAPGACLSRMTAGERQVARVLLDGLEDDCLIWYDLFPGEGRRYPNFIVLHPERGLLFLEVRDWRAGSLKRMSRATCTLESVEGRREVAHPLELGRQGMQRLLKELLRDPRLCRDGEARPPVPCGWGLVLTGIARSQLERGMPAGMREQLLPERQVLHRDELHELEPGALRRRLESMCVPGGSGRLARTQIDAIRWHLFPELRIGDDGLPLSGSAPPPAGGMRVMDLRQEYIARSLGEGQQVVRGGAGSGKTLILGYRCLYLAATLRRPIQVLCFNAALAARLRGFVAAHGIDGRVRVEHFHDWCERQLETWQVELLEGEDEHYWRVADSVIAGVERGRIPGGQYGALLIDEGHDFEPDWLRLLARMIDPAEGSLLLLYDEAQALHRRRSAQGFDLASVGFRAPGFREPGDRTPGSGGVLRRNYRNSREILAFGHCLAGGHLADDEGDMPPAAAAPGPRPALRRFPRLSGETAHAVCCLRQWYAEGLAWGDMALLYPQGGAGEAMVEALVALGIPHAWLEDDEARRGYRADAQRVSVMPIQAAKGLEFAAVVLFDASFVAPGEEADSSLPERVRLLHIGIGRARQRLLVSFHRNNALARALGADELSRYAH